MARQADAGATPVMVCVLGPLRLQVNGDLVAVPGPKRQAVLALLAEASGQTVSAEQILDELWPEGPPVSAKGTLQSHISRLRAHLGSAADRLEHGPAGYRLNLDDGGTDAALAAALLREAETAAPPDAVTVLDRARALWRGSPLAGLDRGDVLQAWAVRLGELRGAIDSAYVAASLATGAADVAVGVARAAVATDLLSERRALDLMHALAASGRIADALRAGYEYRRRVVEETGLQPSQELQELEVALAGAAPSTRSTIGRAPVRLRGRAREVARLQQLLSSERCVTVVGPGGVGKTTLARQVASSIEPGIAVPLSAVPPGADVTPAVADALALRITHGDLLDACTALLGAGPWLLMLDGCEHVLERTRAIVTHLLARCPQLTVLATSRAPLGLVTEQRLRLAPLDLRAPTVHDDVDSSPAVALFVDRARQVEPDLIFDRQELDLVVDIVRRLEGMPLAIELAAGRLSSLGLGDLHARLDHALDVLEGGEVALRQTISWSYDLLRPDDQRLLRHLSIFPDGVAVETAESVASDLGLGLSSHTALGHLVDASMVVRTDAHTSARYRQLDVVRAFAGEALTTVGEMDDAVARFIRWGIGLAEWIDSAIDTPDEPLADHALRRELANLRAVREMLRNANCFDDEVRFVTGLSEAAGWRDLTEVWQWTLELAVHPALVGHDDEVAVVGNAASAAWSRGELERATSLAERGLARGGPTAWRCTSALALIALSRGDLERAAALGEAAGGAATRPEQSAGVAALAAAYRGDIDRAIRLRAKARDIARSPTLSAFDAYVAGEIAASCGNHAEALENYERAIVIARDSGATFVEGIASVGRLTTLAGAGRTAEALQGYSELIGYWDRTDGWMQQWTTMRNLASLLMRLGEERPAVMLTVAADAAPDAPPLGGPERDALIDAALRRYGPETVDTAARATRRQVIAWARTAIDANCATTPDQ